MEEQLNRIEEKLDLITEVLSNDQQLGRYLIVAKKRIEERKAKKHNDLVYTAWQKYVTEQLVNFVNNEKYNTPILSAEIATKIIQLSQEFNNRIDKTDSKDLQDKFFELATKRFEEIKDDQTFIRIFEKETGKILKPIN